VIECASELGPEWLSYRQLHACHHNWFYGHRHGERYGNGGFPPFALQGQLSQLTVCITGGTQIEFSNITLVFGEPASGHFGSQPINGAVRKAER
jgi:hypothetical protein